MSFEFQQRINIVGDGLVIRYYTMEEHGLPWYNFWTEKFVVVNDKNKKLWDYATTYAEKISCIPPFPPLRYVPC